MRYVTILLRPADDAGFHPVGERLAAEPSIRREAIHAVDSLADDSVVMLTEVSGDLDRYREIVADAPSVREFAVSGDEEGFCYVHVEPTPLNRALVERREESEFVVKMPVEYTADGAQRITMVGSAEAFATARADPPEGVEVELESTGEYHPDVEDVFARLTDRQREVLEVAIRQGYYETPREATHESIAEEVGVEPGTVGQHLRAVESTVFGEYVL